MSLNFSTFQCLAQNISVPLDVVNDLFPTHLGGDIFNTIFEQNKIDCKLRALKFVLLKLKMRK